MQQIFNELNKATDILVIGNGFDLHCGLKSSFKDFFESELKSGQLLNVQKIKSNIWYLIFTFAFMLNNGKNDKAKLIKCINKDNPLWMDVEDYIASVFDLHTNSKVYYFINKTLKENDFSTYYENGNDYLNGDYRNQLFTIKQRILELKLMHGFTNAEDLLFFELKNFEKDFARYLKKEVERKKEDYEKEIGEFIVCNLDNYGERNLFVLSFNYTNNFNNNVDKDKKCNIHGSLEEDNIIIGIGDNESSKNSGRELFVKYKRRMAMNFGSLNLPKDNIRNVLFYGCSFSTQDFEYYDYLFKLYKLGEGDTTFTFLYSDFSRTEKENEENRKKYISKCGETIKKHLLCNNKSLNFNNLYCEGKIVFMSLDKFKSGVKN